MKKWVKIFLILFGTIIGILAITLVGFHIFGTKGQSRDDIDVKPADNTIIEDNTKNIDDCTPIESLFILVGKLKKMQSYSATLSGQVTTSMGYTQNVSGEKYIVNNKSLYITTSTSSLKNMAKQIYIENDTVLIRNGDAKKGTFEDTVTAYTLSDYLLEYGIDYRELSNYELNENTITNATFVSSQDGKYTYEYEINVETGTNGYRVNMYKMGNLDSLPTMKKCTLTVVMTNDFMPVTITHVDEYVISMFISVKCKSTLTETFNKINDEDITIPETAFFAQQMTAIIQNKQSNNEN